MNKRQSTTIQKSKPGFKTQTTLHFRFQDISNNKKEKEQKTNKNKQKQRKEKKRKERKDIKSKQIGKHAPTSYQIAKQKKLESIQRNLTNKITNGSMQRHLPGKQTCTKIKKKYRSGGVLCSGCPFPPCTNVIFSFKN